MLDLQTLHEDQFLLVQDITREYQTGMKALNSMGEHTITFYGGSRVKHDSDTYKHIHLIAKSFANKGWGVVTGGGPGVMTAALAGAKEGGGKAVAFCITISGEEPFNNPDLSITFNHFAPRKYCLRQSDVLLYAPGGIGTLDELMENLTLISTKKSPPKPIFLFDSQFWVGYMEWFTALAEKKGLMSMELLSLFKLVDTAEEVEKELFGSDKKTI